MREIKKRKQSLYFPEHMLTEISNEATRQDRSLSWIVQCAWKHAREEMQRIPSTDFYPAEGERPSADPK